ncbi:hypothetical protein MMU07_03660 [Aquiflexum sp. LQ15W]|uniref:hypothetical protein n=1 Tax=Cognataquiflexum nitidum TaxID=2922272 RepID=UPI001F12E60C|nr:hypothetical protein [Cognataquiflexum nitidum]MCH6198663.1 hypothetical protein [Cognataquiflexum nitidum]
MKLRVILFSALCFWVASCSNFPEPSPQNYELFVGDSDSYPKFSPDGEWIAYYHFDAGSPKNPDYPTGLYIIDRNGQNRKLVLEGIHLNPAWSPDGQWLVFSSSGLIQKCKSNGDNLSSLKSMESGVYFFPDFYPDGNFLVFDRMVNVEGSFKKVNSDLLSEIQFFFPEISTGRDPEFSPDGNFLTYMKGSREWPHFEIFSLELKSGKETRLTISNMDDKSPTWSPDGKKIAWSSNVQIHTMDADGKDQKPLVFGVYPSWSVKNEIVYSHANADYTKEVLYIIGTDGKDRRQITY